MTEILLAVTDQEVALLAEKTHSKALKKGIEIVIGNLLLNLEMVGRLGLLQVFLLIGLMTYCIYSLCVYLQPQYIFVSIFSTA